MAKAGELGLEGKPTLDGDAARQTLADDEFGLANMVAALAETLSKRINADGFVLGIEGRWGSGKSTFVNFIAEELKRAPEHHIVTFEPWLIGEKNALLPFFFGQLASKIDGIQAETLPWWHINRWRFKRLKSSLAKRIRKYGEYVGALATPVGGLATADASGTVALSAVGLKTVGIVSKLFGAGTPSLEKLKSEIISELKALQLQRPDIRFTVIIDDTDRLEPDEAVELLRLVRKVADFPFTAYLVCFDSEILSKQVANAIKIEDGNHFLEKIFQDVIHVPPQEPFALRRNLKKKLGRSFPEEMSAQTINDHELEYRQNLIFDRWVGEFIETPRDVVRLHEALKFGWPSVPKGSDFFDFVWLQLVKQKAPKLFQWTQDYMRNVGAYRDGGRAGDTEPRKSAETLNAIMEEFGWADRGHFSGLGMILPGVTSFVLDGAKRKVFDFQHDELEKFEHGKRLGSPSHWRQYFAFDMPSYALRDEEVLAFRQASRDDPAKAATILSGLLERAHDRPAHFVDLLIERLAAAPKESFSEAEAHGMASAFAYTMDDIVSKTGEFRSSGGSEIWRKATRLLRLDTGANFLKVVSEGKSINWLASVVRDQGFAHGLPEGNRVYPDDQWLTKPQLDEAIQIIAQRLQDIGLPTVFHLPSPMNALYCWYQLGDKAGLRRAFADAIQSNEQFLDAMNGISGWANSSNIGIHHPLYGEVVEYFMHADEAKARLERLGDPSAENTTLRDRANELLREWSDRILG